jgi:thiol:disulfide interchange protein
MDEPQPGAPTGVAAKYILLALLVLVAVLILRGRLASKSEPAPGWSQDYQATLDRSRAEGLPLLLRFTATWCGPCQQMERYVLPDPRVVQTVSRFAAVSIDVDAQPSLAQKYGVTAIPTFIVLSPTGAEVARLGPYDSPEAFVTALEQALGKLQA